MNREKFFDKTCPEPNSGCWIWMGSYQYDETHGPRAWVTKNKIRKGEYASRFSYRLFKGVIPNGLVVRHKCDVPLCVNPDHLIIGTQIENVEDRERRGRSAPMPRGSQSPTSKLTEITVVSMRADRNTGMSWVKLAEKYGVSTWAARYACSIGWKHV